MHFTLVDWIFGLFFIFRSRQGGIVSTVLLAVSLTPAKNLPAVLLTPVNSFWAVSLTQVINFRLFGYFWLVSTTPGKNVIAVLLSPAIIVHRCVETGEKFITVVVVTSDHCSVVSLIPAINYCRCSCHRQQLFSSVNDTGDKFIAGINDTANHCKSVTKIYCRCRWHRWQVHQFITDVLDTFICDYLRKFLKKKSK